ncbi:hypothetical protein BDW71DRAFT_208145 [Aspergillus fruticulosus]
MGNESVREKIRALLHPQPSIPRKSAAAAAAASDSDSVVCLIEKEPCRTLKIEAARLPYNGDQCFGSCCRGGYIRYNYYYQWNEGVSRRSESNGRL